LKAGRADGITFEWVEGEAAVEALEGEWRALEGRLPDRMVFSCFDHMIAWYRHMGGAHGRPLIGVARNGDGVIGIAPLALREATIGRVPVRTIDSACHDGDAGELLFLASDRSALNGLFRALLARGGFDVMILCGLRPGGWRHEAVLAAAGEKGIRTYDIAYQYATIDLSNGYEGYFENLSAKVRGNLRRRFKRAEGLGGISLDRLSRPTDSGTLRSYMDRMFRIYERSWKASGQPPLQDHHRLYYMDVAERFNARNMLDLSFLTVGGRDAAFILGYREGTTYYDGTISYDEEFAVVSPGTLLIQEVARRVAAEGVRLLVSHGDREYKKFWVSQWVPQTRTMVFARGARPALAYFSRIELPKWIERMRGGGRSAEAKPVSPEDASEA